ncbi:aldehyde dehydrogenase (NAD+) [Paraburkholderia atlantica]|uniref:aldehyde dehydrogenase family protein n=1 Tax=Paraburkholderia atlantica TaxID=2654982 RepID=UPI00128C1BDA|nr:aldehyde dehydrogenase family protein [Paraburkholderia atlantica]MPW06561.1 aldehyde dehydrogenase family protein [Paraburkholderia atlantica]
MREINGGYINGEFARLHGAETIESLNPATEQPIAIVRLADRDDARNAIAAACAVQPFLRDTSKAERIDMLHSLQAAILARTDDIREATIEEYGGPLARAQWVSRYASDCLSRTADLLKDFPFERQIGDASVRLEPVGVSALIVPWNSIAGTICSKLASALAAGCATVIKPSELAPLQTQVVTEALHAAKLPAGAVNVVLGRGSDVGDELSINPGVRKISFTGSTSTGKHIARAAVDTMKRVSLSLSGKSASIVLPDADLDSAIPLALNAALMNNGQACVNGTRLLVPRIRLNEALSLVERTVSAMPVGDPRDPATVIGPLSTRSQYERIQRYIQVGLAQGATLVTGGEGRPDGLTKGFFVKPTVFADVHPEMDIAKEEIFGPVLCVLAYDSEDEAIRMANDSIYGLQAYVFSGRQEHGVAIASALEAGSVLVNRIVPETMAPFGGVKQSGVGREFGVYGLEAFLEPKSIVSPKH